jgi:hypothetical protein
VPPSFRIGQTRVQVINLSAGTLKKIDDMIESKSPGQEHRQRRELADRVICQRLRDMVGCGQAVRGRMEEWKAGGMKNWPVGESRDQPSSAPSVPLKKFSGVTVTATADYYYEPTQPIRTDKGIKAKTSAEFAKLVGHPLDRRSGALVGRLPGGGRSYAAGQVLSIRRPKAD